MYVTPGRGRRKTTSPPAVHPGRSCARTKRTTSSCAVCARRASSPRSRPCSSGTRRPTCRPAGSRAGASSSRSWPGCCTTAGPTRGSASCSPRSRARSCWPIRPRRRGQRPIAPAGVRPVRPAAAETGRGGGPDHHAGAEGLGGRARRRRLPAVPAVARADRGAQAGRGGVRGVRGRALRRAAGGLRARTAERGRGPAVRCPQARAGAAARPHRRRAAPAGSLGAAPALPARPPAALRRDRGDRGRLRFRPRTDGSRRPPVLHRRSGGATAGSTCASTSATSPADCSPSSTRWATGCTSRGCEPEHYGTPLGETASVGMDEAQARFWENRVGRDRRFWEHFYPQARGALPREPGRRPAGRVSFRGEPRGAVADPGAGRRGDLQPARHDPLRARALADLGRARRGRPARGLERRHARRPGRGAEERRRRAACRTATGPTG